MMQGTNLSGKRAIVTGAAGGFGLVTAETLAEAGASVQICDVDASRLERAIDGKQRIDGAVCDLSDRDATQRFFTAAVDALGGLDILINNVGIPGPVALVEDLDIADWDKTLSINVTSHLQMAQLAMPHLKQAGGGSIVNIASTAGLAGGTLRCPYTVSKWAVIGLTKVLSKEFGSANIRVNCVSPGWVDGDRMDRLVTLEAKGGNRSEEDVRQEYLTESSLGVTLRPQDIANMIWFLVSDVAERISGHNFIVDSDAV